MFRRHGGLKKTGGLSRPLKWQAHLEPAARGGLHLGVEDHLASSLITGESRTVWTLPHTISRQAKAPVHRGFAAPQLMRDTTVQFSCNPLGYGTSRHLLPNRRQGNQLSALQPPPSVGLTSNSLTESMM